LTSQNEKNIIEIGAGKGRLLEAFNKIDVNSLNKINYIGIDINLSNLAELDKYADKTGVKSKFKSFVTQKELQSEDKFDLCILANIIHEVGPDNLTSFFNKILTSANIGASILILEALELAVGEKRFVVFDNEALNRMFDKNIVSNKFQISVGMPISHNGTPLLEYIVKIIDKPLPIDSDDIKNGLDCIVSSTAKDIEKHIKVNNLNGRALAFKSHNLANARAYFEMLS
jgi:hypothetical protein